MFLDRLFGNPGVKIKVVAQWWFIIQSVLSIVSLLISAVAMVGDLGVYGDDVLCVVFGIILLIPIGCVLAVAAAFLSALLLYAFGEVVEAASAYLFHNDTDYRVLTLNANAKEDEAYSKNAELLCKKCWKKVAENDKECPHCGAALQ